MARSPTGAAAVIDPGRPRVAILVKGYPRLSETFIAQEILGLQRLGQVQTIVSLRHPTDRATHPVHDAITADRLYLPEYLHDEPGRVAAARDWARTLPTYRAAYALFRRDFRRDPTPNRWRRFGQACVLAREIPAGTGLLYIHYLHTPCSVGRYAARLLGLPFAVSAHAKDIYTTPTWELREKLAEAGWVATCTAANAAYLRALTDRPESIDLIYHGLAADAVPALAPRPPRDGADPLDPVRLLTVGRAVAKKGIDDLVRALARLPADLSWRWTHIGGGAQLADLKALAAASGLSSRIDWQGPQPRAEVMAAYAAADLFVLPSKIAADGDRDGLPNVLMEAMATGLACLSTRVSAIPEIIDDGRTGRLVEPGDGDALAAVMEALIRAPALRATLGEAGADRVRRDFRFESGLERLAWRFGLAGTGRGADAAAALSG